MVKVWSLLLLLPALVSWGEWSREKTTKAEDTHVSTNLIKFFTDQPSVKLNCCYLILFYDENLQAGAVVPSACVFEPAESNSADFKKLLDSA